MRRRAGWILLVAALCGAATGCGGRGGASGGANGAPPPRASTVDPSPGAPIVLVSIDTLRSDHLPAYGYRGVETPAIDALAGDGVLFERAYAHAPLTLPSHTSLLTGLLPPDHGVRDNVGYSLDRSLPSLPKTLHDLGYATGAAVSSYILRHETGLAAGFDRYDDAITSRVALGPGGVARRGEETLAAALAWLRPVHERPFFLFLHLFEPHTPYEPPEPFASRYASPYDGEIAAADQVVGELVAALRELGVYDRAVVVLLSDHGEGLGEHGEKEHGVLLYREALQVPLVVKLPDARDAGKRVAAPAQLVDVFPTVVELVGGTVPEGLPGSSLLELDGTAPRPIYAETVYPRLHYGWSDLASLIEGRHHWISGPDPELYDLEADPGETVDLRARERRTAAALAERLGRFVRPLAPPAEGDAETRRKLAALGYLGASVREASGPLPDPKERLPTLARFDEGLTRYAAGDFAGAAAAFRRLVGDNPQMVDGWDYLGRTLVRLGRAADAAAAYREALRLSGGAVHLALATADALLRAGRGEEALELLELEAARSPDAREIAFLRVRTLLLLGRPEAAYAGAEELVRQYPDNADALYQRGAVAMGLRRLDAAEADLRRALELAPTHTAAMSDLAVLEKVRGHPEEARRLLRRVLELRPDDATAARNLERLEESLRGSSTSGRR